MSVKKSTGRLLYLYLLRSFPPSFTVPLERCLPLALNAIHSETPMVTVMKQGNSKKIIAFWSLELTAYF
jgi:hypothetical protein